MNPRHFGRLFKVGTGHSPGSCFIELELELELMCLSCPGTPQGEGDIEGLSPALQAFTGGYRSILEQADQCMYVCASASTGGDRTGHHHWATLTSGHA